MRFLTTACTRIHMTVSTYRTGYDVWYTVIIRWCTGLQLDSWLILETPASIGDLASIRTSELNSPTSIRDLACIGDPASITGFRVC